MTRHFTAATATFMGAAGNKLMADVFGTPDEKATTISVLTGLSPW